MFLALLGVAAARPQWLYPINTPLVTMKSVDDTSKLVKPITYTYPTTFPATYGTNFPLAGYPYTYTFPFSPLITSPVVGSTEKRTKRSAEPEPEAEPEADPLTIYSSGVIPSTIPFAGTTTYNYPTTFPIASTYSTFPYTYSTLPYTFPFNYNYAKVVKA